MALIAQYLFRDNANDSSGNGYDGTATNITYEAPPADKNFSGRVAVFNGSSSKIDLPNLTPISGTKAKTIEMWVYIAQHSTGSYWEETVFGCGTGADGQVLQLGTASHNHNGAFANCWAGYKKFSSAAPKMNQWAHYVFISPANGYVSNIQLYLNGVSVSGSQSETNYRVNPPDQNYSLGYRKAGGSVILNGKLAKVRIYDSVLTEAEILSHYQIESTPPSTTRYLLTRRGRDPEQTITQER